MHVTIVYSRRALDWGLIVSNPNALPVENGRRRFVEHLTGNALALIIDAPELVERNRAVLRLGASGDYDPYRPHVTIAYGINTPAPAGKPFAGALHFGPEVMSPVPKRGFGA